MQKPEIILEKMMPKILWDFKKQTGHSILSRKPVFALINKKKKNLSTAGFYYSGGPHSENNRKQKDKQICGPWQMTEKTVEDEVDGYTYSHWCSWNGPKRHWKHWTNWKSYEQTKPPKSQHY